MPILSLSALALLQEAEHASQPLGIISLQTNLMFWTLIIFALLYFILSRKVFPQITKAVEEREKALEAAIDGAKRDREAAAQLLREQQSAIEAARLDAQKLIGEGRTVAEKVRADMIETTRKEQQDMLERARREIETEKTRAIAELRKEAVELALAGASKVIEQNLESDKNRKLIESYLGQISSLKVTQ